MQSQVVPLIDKSLGIGLITLVCCHSDLEKAEDSLVLQLRMILAVCLMKTVTIKSLLIMGVE